MCRLPPMARMYSAIKLRVITPPGVVKLRKLIFHPLSAQRRVDHPPRGGVVGVSRLCAIHLREYRSYNLLTRSFRHVADRPPSLVQAKKRGKKIKNNILNLMTLLPSLSKEPHAGRGIAPPASYFQGFKHLV